mmetsp:Transcript_19494/g.21510  ORF Transcript_19494/g.21510 Transcript_19494/m.21510 type:complete len:135 (-) Transcript_19494:362-766(-)
MEEHVFKHSCDKGNNNDNVLNKDNLTTLDTSTASDSSQARVTTSDRYLVLQGLYWMMEIFPTIMCTPFLLARQISIPDKAEAKLVTQYRSDKAHSLANAIEEKANADVDTNSDNNNNNKHHQNNIRSDMMNPNN